MEIMHNFYYNLYSNVMLCCKYFCYFSRPLVIFICVLTTLPELCNFLTYNESEVILSVCIAVCLYVCVTRNMFYIHFTV